MTQEKGGRTLDEVKDNPNQGVALVGGHSTDVAWREKSMQPEVRSGSGELGTLTNCRSNGEIQIHDGNNGYEAENSNKAESMEMNQMFMVVDLGGVGGQTSISNGNCIFRIDAVQPIGQTPPDNAHKPEMTSDTSPTAQDTQLMFQKHMMTSAELCTQSAR